MLRRRRLDSVPRMSLMSAKRTGRNCRQSAASTAIPGSTVSALRSLWRSRASPLNTRRTLHRPVANPQAARSRCCPANLRLRSLRLLRMRSRTSSCTVASAGRALRNASARPRRKPSPSSSRSAIGLDTGSAAQDYIGLYGGDAKLLAETMEAVQQVASQILKAIGADGSSAPLA